MGETRFQFLKSARLSSFWLLLAIISLAVATATGFLAGRGSDINIYASYAAAVSLLMAFCHWRGLSITHTFFIVIGAGTGAVGILTGERLLAVLGFAGLFIASSMWAFDKHEIKKKIEAAAEVGLPIARVAEGDAGETVTEAVSVPFPDSNSNSGWRPWQRQRTPRVVFDPSTGSYIVK